MTTGTKRTKKSQAHTCAFHPAWQARWWVCKCGAYRYAPVVKKEIAK